VIDKKTPLHYYQSCLHDGLASLVALLVCLLERVAAAIFDSNRTTRRSTSPSLEGGAAIALTVGKKRVRMDQLIQRDAEFSRPFVDNVKIWREGPDEVQTNIPCTVIQYAGGYDVGRACVGASNLALNILDAFVPAGSDGEPVLAAHGQASRFATKWFSAFAKDFVALLPTMAESLRYR
jgi:hypothetical protein